MVALKSVKSIKDILPSMAPIKSIEPIKENHEIYKEGYGKAMKIYHKLYD